MSKTKAIANNIAGDTSTQRILFRILVGSLGTLCLVYIYIIGSITFDVVARKSLEGMSRTLESNISQLELVYLSNLNDVNKDRASSLGFVDINSNIFATRPITQVAVR